jgi:uncharacterized membrane protein
MTPTQRRLTLIAGLIFLFVLVGIAIGETKETVVVGTMLLVAYTLLLVVKILDQKK